MSKEEVLKEAITTGELLRITYDGGRQPGAERDISPISVKDGKVRARCYSSNAVKLFVVDKITILGSSSGDGQEWTPGVVKKPDWNSISEIVEAHREEWEAAGWHIVTAEDHIDLHMYGKHKKLLKYPTVSIHYHPTTTRHYFDWLGDGGEVSEVVENKTPWTVTAKNFSGSSFKYFEKAANRFIERSRQITPNPPPPTK